MKGWAITLASALIAVFVSNYFKKIIPVIKIYLFAAIASTFLFWCLDAFYLSKERKFIGIYNDLIGVENGKKQKSITVKEFEIPLKNIMDGNIALFELCYYLQKLYYTVLSL